MRTLWRNVFDIATCILTQFLSDQRTMAGGGVTLNTEQGDDLYVRVEAIYKIGGIEWGQFF
jgi:hypothetical protein